MHCTKLNISHRMDSASLMQLLEHFKLQVDTQLDTITDALKTAKAKSLNQFSLTSLSTITKDNSFGVVEDFERISNISCSNDGKIMSNFSTDENNKTVIASGTLKPTNMVMNSTPKLPIEDVEFVKKQFREARKPIPVPVILPLRRTLNYVNVPLGSFIKVQLSYIFSARNFYVHFNYTEVEQFYIKFNERCNATMSKTLLKSHEIELGMLCCVHNPNDETYYRAQVIQNKDGKYEVLLADFGEILTVEISKMYILEPEFADIPIFAINCCVAGIFSF